MIKKFVRFVVCVFLFDVESVLCADAICDRIDFNDVSLSKLGRCSGSVSKQFFIKRFSEGNYRPYRNDSEYYLSNNGIGLHCGETTKSFYMNAFTEIRMIYQLVTIGSASIAVRVLNLDVYDENLNPVVVQAWGSEASTTNWNLFRGKINREIRRAKIQIESNVSFSSDIVVEYLTVFNPLVQEEWCKILDEYYTSNPPTITTTIFTTYTTSKPTISTTTTTTSTTLQTTTTKVTPGNTTIIPTSKTTTESTRPSTINSTTTLPTTTTTSPPMTTSNNPETTISPEDSTTLEATIISTSKTITTRPTTTSRTTTTTRTRRTKTTTTTTRTTTPTATTQETTTEAETIPEITTTTEAETIPATTTTIEEEKVPTTTTIEIFPTTPSETTTSKSTVTFITTTESSVATPKTTTISLTSASPIESSPTSTMPLPTTTLTTSRTTSATKHSSQTTSPAAYPTDIPSNMPYQNQEDSLWIALTAVFFSMFFISTVAGVYICTTNTQAHNSSQFINRFFGTTIDQTYLPRLKVVDENTSSPYGKRMISSMKTTI